eukprot:2842071-Alexandrium_andersonii.AAC.1
MLGNSGPGARGCDGQRGRGGRRQRLFAAGADGAGGRAAGRRAAGRGATRGRGAAGAAGGGGAAVEAATHRAGRASGPRSYPLGLVWVAAGCGL